MLSPDRPYNILFLCRGNHARSILAESILRKDGAGRFEVYSAGSHPRGTVHPLAIEELRTVDYPVDNLRSKSWDEYTVPGAPVMDFVFTLCDSAKGEVCPTWPGRPLTAHWGIDDPAAVEGGTLERQAAFVTAFRHLKNRIALFTALPIQSLDEMSLQRELREIGHIEGASMSRDGVA